MQQLIKGYGCRRWFPLDGRVREHLSLSLNRRHVPRTDIYVATSPYTAFYLNDYDIDGSRKFYFIQDYENWGWFRDEERLRATYRYDMRRIVVSSWLKRLIEREGGTCELIPNGFDFNYFRMDIPIKEKDRHSVTMMYHIMERKGCEYGIAALKMVKERFPDLTVNLFGVPPRPDDLPEWFRYYRSPDRETHNRIYNESAIYLAPSVTEGWGLTIGEAMICGAAVVCTDADGFREMAADGVNALLSPVRNAESLADNMIRLIEDDGLRQRIAERGNRDIRRFTWDSSYDRLKTLFQQ